MLIASGNIKTSWLLDVLATYDDTYVWKYIINNGIPLSPEGMLEKASDEIVLKFIDLDNELGFMSSAIRTNLYLNTGRDIFLKFEDRNRDEVDVEYNRLVLSRSNGFKLILIFDGVQDLELTDSDIRLIYTLGHRVEIRRRSKLSIVVRLLDYIPIDRLVEEEHTSTIPDETLADLYIKYPLGVRRLWEQYSLYNPLYLDIAAYYLPIKISTNFKPSVIQLAIFNYLKKSNEVTPNRYKNDLSITLA
jgi:hypothetical protein